MPTIRRSPEPKRCPRLVAASSAIPERRPRRSPPRPPRGRAPPTRPCAARTPDRRAYGPSQARGWTMARCGPGTAGSANLSMQRALEAGVADREDLVDEEHLRVHVDGHGEARAHVHARGVVLDRHVDELLEPGEARRCRRTCARSPAWEGRGWRRSGRRSPGRTAPDGSRRPAPAARRGPVDLTRPRSGRRMPARHLKSVLLPEPFSPMTRTTSPVDGQAPHLFSAQNSSYRGPTTAEDRRLQIGVASWKIRQFLPDILDDYGRSPTFRVPQRSAATSGPEVISSTQY